jgi:hypothetical protein
MAIFDFIEGWYNRTRGLMATSVFDLFKISIGRRTACPVGMTSPSALEAARPWTVAPPVACNSLRRDTALTSADLGITPRLVEA